MRDRELRKIERNELAEPLIAQARESIEAVDLSEGARLLAEDFGVREACGWVRAKFGIELDVAAMRSLDVEPFKRQVREMAMAAYDRRETEFAVLNALEFFTTQDGQGQKRVDRERLVAWARERFDVDISVEDLKNRQRDEIQALLVEHSKAQLARASAALVEAHQQVDKLYAGADAEMTAAVVTGGNGALTSLSSWLRQSLHCDLPPENLAKLNREQLERKLEMAVEDRYRPEMRRLERELVLQILDAAWKDHLLAMDHLRASVGLRGYAQVDPKVEYKREGMRTFELMWSNVAERVTDLIFRMEHVEERSASSFVEGSAIHDEAPPATDITDQQQSAIDASQADRKIEPIRNRQERVGRNDPCTCGSGKKFKNCCMRKQGG